MNSQLKDDQPENWWKVLKKGEIVQILKLGFTPGENIYIMATALEDPQDFVNTMYREVRCDFLTSEGRVIKVGTRSNPYIVKILFSDKS